jgi:hypothetical protein
MADVIQAAEKAGQAFEQAKEDSQQETYYLDSVALNLHAVYSGVERIFEWIGRDFDGGLPQGATWHRDLLMQMTLSIEEVRPAVLHRSTAEILGEFLRFRHLVRNLYTWNFEAERLSELIRQLPVALAALSQDLDKFGRFLDEASHADEHTE